MRYATIVADPPWSYDGSPMPYNVSGPQRRAGGDKKAAKGPRRGVAIPYPTLTVAEIGALPVGDLAEPDARLFCWATNRHLPFAFGIIADWGFAYRQLLVWHKTKSTPLGADVTRRAPRHWMQDYRTCPGCGYWIVPSEHVCRTGSGDPAPAGDAEGPGDLPSAAPSLVPQDPGTMR